MKVRSDLMIEHELLENGSLQTDNVTGAKGEMSGVSVREEWNTTQTVKITSVQITSEEAAKRMERPLGNYITLEIPLLKEERESVAGEVVESLTKQLKLLLSGRKAEHMLVIGLGNREVTADAIGPLTVENLMVTRHLLEQYPEVVDKYRVVSALVPGVMAQTGMETMEIIHGIVREIKPDIVLVIDALAARSATRLNTTIQLTDTGICPGAGVGNNRRELSETSLGIPVFAVGVPTVLDAAAIAREEVAEEIRELFVTARTIDSAVYYISEILADGINRVNGRKEQ